MAGFRANYKGYIREKQVKLVEYSVLIANQGAYFDFSYAIVLRIASVSDI